MTTDINHKSTHLLVDQIPDYVQEYYPLFVIFVTKYFEWLDNTSTGVQHTIQNIRLNRDIDTTANNLAIQFLNTYVPNLPSVSAVDDSILVKHFRDVYRLKGSEKSFRFFFKAFFNDDITVTYPRNVLFKTSDGDYYIRQSLRVLATGVDPELLQHVWVTGNTTNARAIVNQVDRISGQGSLDYYDLVFEPNSILGTFSSSEAVVGIYYDHVNATSSEITVTSVASLATDQGVYRNSNSQLSYDQVLQDSLYYQQFSYVIKSRFDRDTWADHVLAQLHPTGTILFNELTAQTNPAVPDVDFGTSLAIETTVTFPTEHEFILGTTFTFDRTADLQTGTSTTQIVTTSLTGTVALTSGSADLVGTGTLFTLQVQSQDIIKIGTTSYTVDSIADDTSLTLLETAAYSTSGATAYINRNNFVYATYDDEGEINYDAGFDFPGEHITFALQTLTDVYTGDNRREVVRLDGATWDKLIRSVDIDEQLIAWGYDINSSLTVTRYTVSDGITSSDETIVSITSGVLTYKIDTADINATSVGSMILLVTYVKNSRGNRDGEENNDIVIRVSSDATTVLYFDPEAQRNYKRIALNNSLGLNELIYYHSSNSVQYQIQTPGYAVTDSSTSILTGVDTTFESTFFVGDRIHIDDFETTYIITEIVGDDRMFIHPLPVTNYTSSIIYHTRSSGIPVSSATYVDGSEAIFRFKPYNGQRGSTYDRFAMRIELDQQKQRTTSITETFDGTYAAIDGVLEFTAGSTSITGLASAFTTDLSTGQLIRINDYTNVTTSYTVVNINSDTDLTVTPALIQNSIDSYFTSTLITGDVDITAGTSTITAAIIEDALDGTVEITAGTSSITGTDTLFSTELTTGQLIKISDTGPWSTSYAVQTIDSDTSITVSPVPVDTDTGLGVYAFSYAASVFTSSLATGALIRLATASADNTSYTITNIYNDTSIAVTPVTVFDSSDLAVYRVTSAAVGYALTIDFSNPDLIASYSSNTASIVFNSFTSTVSEAYVFDSNAFIFNGGSSITNRYIQTTSFPECGQLDLSVDYLVGDYYNGGEQPDGSEDLEIQYSINGGSSWLTAHKIWVGSSASLWTYGSTSISGEVFTTIGSNSVRGVNTNFSTDINVGDRLLLNTSNNTTAYTVTTIVNNTEITVTPDLVDSFRNSTSITGRIWGPDNTIAGGYSRIFGVGTAFTELNRDQIISIGSSTTTAYTIVNIISDTVIDVFPELIDSYVTSAALTGTIDFSTGATITGTATAFTTELTTGSIIRISADDADYTSYTVVSIPSDTSITVTPDLVDVTSGATALLISSNGVTVSSYLINAGVPFYRVIPARDQFQTTSVTVYGPGPETSIVVRIAQISASGPNDDVYAINRLNIDSYRYQETTGVINIHVAVSSGTDLYVSDTDYIDITTIGTI